MVSNAERKRLQRCLDEARIWRDEGRPKKERHRARRRFDYALRAIGCNPLERLQIHLAAVCLADASRGTSAT